MNDNGLRLLAFAASTSLLIGNSYFQHPRKHKLTWRCPKGTDSAVLDYFLIPSRFHSSFQDIRVMRGADCGSDHHLVVMKVKLRLKRSKRISAPVSRRDWSRLADPICKQQFELKLRNRFETLKEPENADEATEQFASVTVDCANAFCPIMRRRTQAWISNECLDMMDQRKKCKCTDINRYRELHHAVRQRLKQERKQHWDNVATELENAASRREFRTLYTTLRRLRGHDRAADECIKKKNGEYVKTNAERLFRWREYFQELYNRPIPETPPPSPTDLQPIDFRRAT
ncbi:hypothetical protein ANCDUO_23555 [Ancylostoma duodenale]|uniref:Endonuclease/exonuclease/phosphatase domain-containing protein n=1 Tax=Ancylostoma duodenale TaxID=51022 RepID=A0A0C2BRH8_9BILA|nr:hypothetical protein ANCDUO_23555 [Ancylostoma duodenale]